MQPRPHGFGMQLMFPRAMSAPLPSIRTVSSSVPTFELLEVYRVGPEALLSLRFSDSRVRRRGFRINRQSLVSHHFMYIELSILGRLRNLLHPAHGDAGCGWLPYALPHRHAVRSDDQQIVTSPSCRMAADWATLLDSKDASWQCHV